jgi:hypothetical protein
MIDLNINGKIYRHPSKIEEVTLEQWIAVQAAEQSEDDTSIHNDFKAFSAFSGIPIKVLKSAPSKDMHYHISVIRELMGDISRIDDSVPKSFNIGKVTYNVEQDIDGADMSQYIDCTHYMNMMHSSPEFYPYMMAIYCLKPKEKYNAGKYNLEKRADEMLKCNIVDALRVNAFFLDTSENFLQDSLRYLGAK